MSNNVGEYSALFAFLKWFIKLQSETSDLELRSSAIIHSDSQLLINQMDGKWKIKSGLYVPYYINCCDIIREYNLRVRLFYKWIPREENVEADRLSKQAYGS